jgi:hypothetical protein
VLNQKTCIVQEIRSKFLGIQTTLKEMALSGKLTQIIDSEREEADDERQLKRRSQRKNPTDTDLKAV